METNYLRTFVMVVDSGSMSEAARQLHVTPAAVAQQLRVLERELGTALLHRTGRTVTPTEAGHRLVDHARAVLHDVARLREVALDEPERLELVIGATNTMMNGLMPALLDSLASAHPLAHVVVRAGMSSELYDGILRAELDAALCLRPDFALPKSVRWALLRDEKLVVIAPAGSEQQDPHELLRREPLIRYDRRLGGGQAAQRYLDRAGIVPRERFEVSSLAAIAMLVARGLGVSIAPDATTAWWPNLAVARLALPRHAEARRFGVLWSRASPRTRAIQALVEHARRVVGASA